MMQPVALAQIPAQPGRTLVLAGAGTPALTLTARLSRLLIELRIEHELLGSIIADWNAETRVIRPCLGPTLTPPSVLPGLPHGFGANTDLCRRFRPQWLPWLEEAFRRLHHRSAQAGLVGGLVIEPLTAGGHLPVSYEIARLAREHFSQAFRLATFWLPSDLPQSRLWGNLRQWKDFPTDLAVPLLVADNAFRGAVDRAVPLALAGILAGRHLADPTTWSLVETLQHLTAAAPVLGVAYAHVPIPLIPQRVLGLPIGRRQVAAAELPLRLADLLVRVLSPAAALLPVAPHEIGREAFSLAVLTGFPRLQGVERERFAQDIQAQANQLLTEQGQPPLPAGLRLIGLPVFWMADGFARLEATWLFPVRVGARQLVERMLAGAPARSGGLATPSAS